MTIKQCIQAMQGAMTAKERFLASEKKLCKAEGKLAEKTTEIEELKRSIADLRRTNADLDVKFAEGSRVAERLKLGNKELATYAKKKKAEVIDAGSYWVSRARYELLKEFKEERADKWKVDDEIGEYEGRTARMAEPCVEDNFPLPELD